MRRIVMIVLVLAAIALIAGLTLYNKPHRSVDHERAVSITAAQLFREFEANEEMSNKKYLDKVLEVTGTIAETSVNQDGQVVVRLETQNPMFGIQCTLDKKQDTGAPMITGDTVIIKGICTGYLSDVVITSGIIIKTTPKL